MWKKGAFQRTLRDCKAARNGSIESAVYLAEMYFYGEGGSKNLKSALKWLNTIDSQVAQSDDDIQKWWNSDGKARTEKLREKLLLQLK